MTKTAVLTDFFCCRAETSLQPQQDTSFAGHQLHRTHNYIPTVPLAHLRTSLFPSDPEANTSFATARAKVTSFLICPYSSQSNLVMALLCWTTCFPAFEALRAMLNINWGSGQLKARARSPYCHTGKQSWGNFALHARVQQHFAQLGALPMQMITKRQQYLVPCLQYPY